MWACPQVVKFASLFPRINEFNFCTLSSVSLCLTKIINFLACLCSVQPWGSFTLLLPCLKLNQTYSLSCSQNTHPHQYQQLLVQFYLLFVIKYLSIAYFIVEAVLFDNKKNPLLPVITKFSPRDFKLQHPKTIIPFREFAPDRPEEKEVQRLPVRFFEKNVVPQCTCCRQVNCSVCNLSATGIAETLHNVAGGQGMKLTWRMCLSGRTTLVPAFAFHCSCSWTNI